MNSGGVSEEEFEAQFTELLGRLRFDDEVLEWVREALHASHADERCEHEEAIRRHQAEYKRLDERIHAMCVDKLEGLVDTAFCDRMSNQWRKEPNRCQCEIERHQNADKILSGRRHRAARTRPQRAEAVRKAGTTRKTPPAEFRIIEIAPGKMAKWSPPSANLLTSLRRRHPLRCRRGGREGKIGEN
jgi:predicted nuclease with TOPRIM domain